MGQLITQNIVYCIQDNVENRLHLKHTLDRKYRTNILHAQFFEAILHNGDNEVPTKEYEVRILMYPIIFTHLTRHVDNVITIPYYIVSPADISKQP